MVVAFFCPHIGIAVERRRDPHLLGRPLALVDSAERLSVVSDEAAACGVMAGQKLSGARTLCGDLCAAAYDPGACRKAARPIWNLLADESSVVEPVSPELCYLELPESDALTRISVLSVQLAAVCPAPYRLGMGRSKLVARLAAGRTGETVHVIPHGEEAAFLARIPLQEAVETDAKTIASLARLDLKSLGDVLRIALHKFPKALRPIAYTLRCLAVGDDGAPVLAAWPPKQMDHRMEFEYGVSDKTVLHQALDTLAGEIASELLENGQIARKVLLALSLDNGSRQCGAVELGEGAARQGVLARAALRLLDLHPVSTPVTGLTLTVTELSRGSGMQLTLLDARSLGELYPHERDSELAASLGFLRRRYGAESVRKACLVQIPHRRTLWTYPLGVKLDDPIDVRTDSAGLPACYTRHGRSATIAQITDLWKENDGLWDSAAERTHYRVQTDQGAIYEIEQTGSRWRITAAAD